MQHLECEKWPYARTFRTEEHFCNVAFLRQQMTYHSLHLRQPLSEKH